MSVYRLAVPPCVVSALLLLAAIAVPFSQAAAQRAIPDSAPINNFNPLCDSSLVHCLEIDHFAGHVYAHLQVLPKTDRRDTAAVFPIGVMLGLFGRVAGGISTYYAFWRESDGMLQQLGPLRLSLTGRLLSLFRSSGDSADEPSRSFQLGLTYEHEVRVGPFSGGNSLGLLTDLASLYLVGSKWLGPLQLSTSLGALFDWRGSFATGAISGQLGWLIPGFRQLKIHVQGMTRGGLAYVKSESLPPMPDGKDPLHLQGLVGGGLAFRAHRRVDLSVEMNRGFGSGIAPWTIGVNFLIISGGKAHEGQAITPVAQLAADVVAEAAKAVREYVASLPIDPKLDENCFILDRDDVTILGRFGKRTKNGYYCEEDGFRVPIGHEFERDRQATRLCRDSDLKDCFLERHGRDWVPIHQPKLDGSCDMYDTDDTYLGRLGAPTADGRSCLYAVKKANGAYGKYVEYKEKPIGVPFHTDADRSRVCTDANMKDCFMLPAEGRGTLAIEGSERYAKHADRRFSSSAQEVLDTAQSIENVATGKTSLTTVGAEMKRTAGAVAQAVGGVVKNPEKIVTAAANTKNRLVKAIADFEHASPERKLDTLGDLTGDGLAEGLKAGAMSGAGHLVGGGVGAVRTVANAEEVLTDAAKAGKQTAKVVKTAEHAQHTIVDAATVGAAREMATEAAPRITNGANHVFGPKSLTKHKLDGLLHAFGGDKVAAFNALEQASQQLANKGAIKGVFEKVIEVGGQSVTVRGAVVDGIARVSTAFVP